jgi:hypothetical protein
VKGIRVTVEDLETGEREEKVVPPGEYLLLTVEPCHLHYTSAFANGTHIITVKGRTA